MSAPTTFRPAGSQQRPGGTRTALPDGAAKMSRTYLDHHNVPQKSLTPVPVDADERRTPHLLYQCSTYKPMNGGGKERCPVSEWMLPESKARFCPEHGGQLTVDKERSTAVETVMDAARLHGRSALPWTLPAAGVAVDLAMNVTGVAAVDAALAVPVAAVAAYQISKSRLTKDAIAKRRIDKGQRKGRRVEAIRARARRHAAVTAEAGVWITALGATDLSTIPGLIVASAGMVRWAVGAAGWWNAADERRTRGELKLAEPVAPVTVEAPDPVKLRAVMTWKALIGCTGGPLAGTELVDWERLPACDVGASSRSRMPNWSAKVVATIPGSINMRANRPELLGRLAAAYGCTYADVSFAADESDVGVGWVRIQPDNVLAEVKLWTGPKATDWSKGISRIGRFDDGQPIHYRWWTKLGAAHDLIGGSSGGGKSELVAQLLLASLHSNGLVLDWVGDPQGGQSFGALKDAVDWFARGRAEIKVMLLSAVKEMYRRNDELTAKNIKTWMPSRSMPLLVITLDEVQSYIEDPDILPLVEMLAGMARKCGIKMRLVTQIVAAYNLGGSTYIKDQVKTGQTLTFRSATDIGGRSSVEGDSPIDPTALPAVWGPNTCSAGETTAGLMFVQGLHGRDVYGRADYTGEDMKVWLFDEAGNLTITPGVFGRDAQQVAGVLWHDRKERARLLLESGRSDEDILPGGKAVELIQATMAITRPDEVAALAGPSEQSLGGERARDVVLAAAKAAASGDGTVGKDQIVAGLPDMKAGTRDKALTDLVADGDLGRVRNGVYRVRQ